MISHISVGVADNQNTIDFWTGHIGLELLGRRAGADPDLSTLWSLGADQITEQALLRTPGTTAGYLHLVQFRNPHSPVRENAIATDLGPKNLDVNCIDMPARRGEFAAAGFRFRSDIAEYCFGDIHAREVQMHGHDDTNVLFVETLNETVAVSDKHYGAITAFVVIVPDGIAEMEFCSAVLDLDLLIHHRLSGPEIEAVIGLPAGASLDVRLMGRESERYGRLELACTLQTPSGLNLDIW